MPEMFSFWPSVPHRLLRKNRAAFPGTTAASGVTGSDATDAPEADPMPFAPVTVKVYDVPGSRSATTQEVAGAVTTHEPPAVTEVTV